MALVNSLDNILLSVQSTFIQRVNVYYCINLVFEHQQTSRPTLVYAQIYTHGKK